MSVDETGEPLNSILCNSVDLWFARPEYLVICLEIEPQVRDKVLQE